MRPLYKLYLPRGANSPFKDDFITLPCNDDGLKLAEWWALAPRISRMKVAEEGTRTNDYIGAWKKIASEMMEPVSEKSEHDLKDTIRALEAAHEQQGEDPSTFSEPPTTNP